MVSNYRKGYGFEYRVWKKLESKGYIVFRCSRSKPFDLIAFDIENGVIYLIECKKGSGRLSKKQREMQSKIYGRLKSKFNVKYIVIHSGERNTYI